MKLGKIKAEQVFTPNPEGRGRVFSGTSKTLKVYACGVEWQHEIQDIPIEIYPTVKSLKSQVTCYHECGIVELEVKLKRWIKKQDFSHCHIKRGEK